MTNIGFKIENEDSASIVKGEDVSLAIRLFDATTKEPIDLSNIDSISVELARENGGKIVVRDTSALDFADENVSMEDSTIAIEAHGLADNEPVALTNAGGALPTGLAAQNYFTKVVDKDTIQLMTEADGEAVEITAAEGDGVHTLTRDADVVLEFVGANDAILGKVTLKMSEVVTAALLDGERLTPELEWVEDDITRIVQLKKALTVLEQAL